MTGTRQPSPVGDPLTAYRRVLARARRAETQLRELKARQRDDQLARHSAINTERTTAS